MSTYVAELIRDDLARPSLREWLDELRQRPRHPELTGVGARAVREGREAEGQYA